MITQFDDYCIHQTTKPVAEPSQSDRNFYDRYWFNGMDADGNYLFEVGLGLYPNRKVMDGHFSVAQGSRQSAFHSSRRAPKERGETVIGPFSVVIETPMRAVRVRLEDNDTGIACDLLFTACSVPHQEPQNIMYDDGALIMETSRFTQMGHWNGWFSVDGERTEVRQAVGCRDKSWGVRPVGEPAGGAPGLMNAEPGVYWAWNPVNWGDFCTQFGSFEDRDGRPTQLSADLLPLYQRPEDIPQGEDPGMVSMTDIEHSIEWKSGTRWPKGASFSMSDKDGQRYAYTLETRQRFQMLGIGYNHAEWGHALWKGELETGREDWNLDEVDPLDYQFIHNHHVVIATMDDGRKGVGTLETICIGRQARYGFKDFFDPAP